MDLFLTPRQLEILKLRQAGKTQEEIAGLLGTTRENISIAEKRARENVKKARRTLEAYERLTAIEVDLKDIKDPVKIPRAIFTEADRRSIKVAHSATDILEMINAYTEEHGKHPIKVFLMKSGNIRLE